ncbi:MAG: 6-oxocyclohex-1-ene-1-carbonyl-CoA hydratase [Planctomycetota bacterium]|nr:MAG: 6-oxocyclohex-1-ene-1-carbonyl-CoA hydratase [Planctomycetota bacterium]
MTVAQNMTSGFLDHELAPDYSFHEIRYETRPVKLRGDRDPGSLVNAWIWLDNPRQYNSYTTRALAELILALRKASNDPKVQCVVFTAVGDKAFCTGGNTAEYSEHYSGRPDEYRRYMRLFNDAVSALMECDKPVINRVNGMRIAGGQEIGMACDFTVCADTARFGQAGPKHGSAPVGGSTDFLPLYVGWAKAVESCTLCETWTAHEALQFGLVNAIAPVLRVEGRMVPNPLVELEFRCDEFGRSLYGKMKSGEELQAAKAQLKSAEVDFSLLDAEVEGLAARLVETMPECTTFTLENLRRHKLAHWDRNREGNRAWLGLNMLAEAKAGFRTFHRAPRAEREADFVAMRQALADGVIWGDALLAKAAPYAMDSGVEE